jgi:hypothetical protein
MKPSDETIEKFQKIYFEEFGEKISKEEAYGKFLRLVNFVRVTTRKSANKITADESSNNVDHFP